MSKELREDSHCGLYCGSCPIILAIKRSRLKSLARMWKVPSEDLECSGCRSDKVSTFCNQCTIRDCAREKEIGFCIDCESYPCHHYLRLKEFSKERPHLLLQPGELVRVKELGEKAWMNYHHKRWSCHECGETFGWYDERCSKCGADVRNSVVEVGELDLTVSFGY